MKRLTITFAALAVLGGLVVTPAIGAHASSEQTAMALNSVADAPESVSDGPGADQRGIAGVAKALHAGFKAASAYKAAAQVAGWASILGRSETPNSVDAQLESAYFDR
ncbi:hypothetical protein [Curtobacterium sp. RRHDQ10]|uniref:hypothetical protein n=1 Tax=Curtobacterium phyllosphaerae TaxID=3413379 RepID=UPI003BEF8251